MKQVQEYWPDFLREVKEFSEVAKAENPELALAWKATEDLINDQYIRTATPRGVVRRERMLGITPFATDSIESRKWRILARWNDKLPYTYKVLENRLTQLCGDHGFTLKLNANEYALSIEVLLAQSENFSEIQILSEKMIPANIMLDVVLVQPIPAKMYFAGVIQTGDYITIRQVM